MTLASPVEGQDANYDEQKIPPYELPNPLITDDGQPVLDADQWTQRRKEILTHFHRDVYGCLPPQLDSELELQSKITLDQVVELQGESDSSDTAKPVAIRVRLREVELTLTRRQRSQVLHLLVATPAGNDESVPAFLGYNFNGNHSTTQCPEVTLRPTWDRKQRQAVLPTEDQRGSAVGRWPIDEIVRRGYGLVTLHYADVDPDFDDGFQNGVHTLYPELQQRDDNWSSLGGWAWGLHRVLDWMERDPLIDAERVAVFGHSRLGKTALWTGATDPRFALTISNNSGCGGAALARRRIGETVARINRTFPHWFCRNHRQFNDQEDALPVDQHELLALMAPRPVYVASASEDRWADPRGEFLAAFHASPVYRCLGLKGLDLASQAMPTADQSLGQRVGYHCRTGKHNITRSDWRHYLDFADRWMESNTP